MTEASCANCRFRRTVHGLMRCQIDPPQRYAITNDRQVIYAPSDWPLVTAEDWCGKHEARGAIDDYKYQVFLRQALGPFLRVAAACAGLDEAIDDNLILLDLRDPDTGETMSLTGAQFIALADAVPEV